MPLGFPSTFTHVLLRLPHAVLLQRRIVAQNIKRLKDIGCYRGRRHIMVSMSVYIAACWGHTQITQYWSAIGVAC